MTRLPSPQRLLAAVLSASAAFLVIPEIHAAVSSGAGHHAARLGPALPDLPQLAAAASADATGEADRCPLCLAMGQARSGLAQTLGVRTAAPHGSQTDLPARPDAWLPGDVALCDASPRAPPTLS